MNNHRPGDADQQKPALRPLTPKRGERTTGYPHDQEYGWKRDAEPAERPSRPVEQVWRPPQKAPETDSTQSSQAQPERVADAPDAQATSAIRRSVRVPLWAVIAVIVVLLLLPAAVVVTQLDPFQSTAPSDDVAETEDEVEPADDAETDEVAQEAIEPILGEDLFADIREPSDDSGPRSSRQEFLAEQGVRPDDYDISYGADEVERLQRELEAIQRNSAMLRSLARQQSGDLSMAYSSLEATEEEKDGALEDLQARIDELEGRVQAVDELARDLRNLLGLPQSESGVGGPVEMPSDDADPWLTLRSEIVAVEQHAGSLVYNLDEVNTEIQLRLAQVDQTGLPRGASLQSDLQFYEAMPLGWPIDGPVTSRFGLRANPFGEGTDSHTGIDISAPLGAPVRATGGGTVRHAGEYGGYGLLVIVDHGRGVSTWYGHNSDIRVTEGQWVEEGDALADVGSTGMSTGPHVHYEIRISNQPQDPLSLMEMDR